MYELTEYTKLIVKTATAEYLWPKDILLVGSLYVFIVYYELTFLISRGHPGGGAGVCPPRIASNEVSVSVDLYFLRETRLK